MDKKNEKRNPSRLQIPKKDLPDYEAPKVVTYHEDDILEELGPAQACTSPCPSP